MLEITSGAKGDGVTNDTSDITSAIATGQAIHLSYGTYLCDAPIALNIGQSLTGEGTREVNGKPTVLLCNTNSGTPGVFLRLPAFNKLRNLKVKGTSKDIAGWTGVRLSQTEYRFAPHIEVSDVDISGFDLGLDVNNTFLTRYKNINVYSCRRGARWLPSNDAGDNGYYDVTPIRSSRGI